MSESNVFMHEIKNSLSNVYSLVEIIENDPKEIRSCLPLIKLAINQIKNLEYDYDEFRKSGKTVIRIVQVNLATLLTSIAEEYRGLAEEKKVSIKVISKNIKVQSDIVRLRQVLGNLITNAIKYNLLGGQILLECKTYGDKTIISVSDTGIGMSQDEIRMLGTMFYRSKKIDAPGTGLGWALIKSIADLMQWDISVKSKAKPTSGFEYTTTISITL